MIISALIKKSASENADFILVLNKFFDDIVFVGLYLNEICSAGEVCHVYDVADVFSFVVYQFSINIVNADFL